MAELSEFMHRTQALFGDRALAALQEPRLAISGLGGVGGAAFMTLVRSGVRRFRLAENGIFDPPDMNRQWGALAATMDRPKLEVYAEWARGINPKIELELFAEGINPENIAEFLTESDLYIGAIDVDKGQSVKDISNRICRETGIPIFTCGAIGCGALMVNYDPLGMKAEDFWHQVALKSEGKRLLPTALARFFAPGLMTNLEASVASGKLATCGVGGGQAGLLLASEVLNYLLRDTGLLQREICFAPGFVALDLWQMTLVSGDITQL